MPHSLTALPIKGSNSASLHGSSHKCSNYSVCHCSSDMEVLLLESNPTPWDSFTVCVIKYKCQKLIGECLSITDANS